MNGYPLLEIRDLTVGYTRPRHPPRLLIEGIDARLKSGEFVCLLGPN